MSTETDKIRANAVDSTAQADAIDAQQPGDNQDAIDELEGVAIPALQTATTSVQAALDMLKKKPEPPVEPPSGVISISPDGGPEQQATTLKNALDLSMSTGRTIVSGPGTWDLSAFGWYDLHGIARWVQPAGQQADVDFGYRQLGGALSIGSGGGLHLEGLNIKGYDRLAVLSEADFKNYNDSYEIFRDGAQPIMKDGWAALIEYRRCNFEATPVMMRTGGGFWNNGFKPSNPNPGIEKVLIENCSMSAHGGYELQAIRWNEMTFRDLSFRGDATKEALYAFYRKFGVNPETYWSKGAGKSTTGEVLTVGGYRSKIMVGRTNPTTDGTQLYYFNSNGPVIAENLTAIDCYVDLVPDRSKYTQSIDFHLMDARSAKVKGGNLRAINLIDYSWTDHAYAKASEEDTPNTAQDTSLFYLKGIAEIDGLSATNVGPGEGPTFEPKPGMAGTFFRNTEARRDKSMMDDPWLTRLNDFARVTDRGRLFAAPGEVPNPDRTGLRPSKGAFIDGFQSWGYIPPPDGWEKSIHWWLDSEVPTNVTHMDLAGNILWQS